MVKKTNTPKEVSEARAARIQRLRKTLNLSRSAMAEKYEKYGLTYNALQSWEKITWYGLTESGAYILAEAFQKEEGLQVTVEWLLFGVGDDPLPDTLTFLKQNNKAKLSEPGLITEEIQFFHQNNLNHNTVDAIIVDDALEPCFKQSDYVAGIRYFDHEIEWAIGHPSIVQTETGHQLIRIVTLGKDLGIYTLICSNPESTAEPTLLKDIKLVSAAPILWHRKSAVKK